MPPGNYGINFGDKCPVNTDSVVVCYTLRNTDKEKREDRTRK